MSAKLSAGFLLLSIVVGSTPAIAGLEVRQLNRPFAVGDSQGVRIEAPLGHLTTETWDDDAVAVEVALECSGEVMPCRDAARAVALASERHGERLVVRVTGPWPAEDKVRPWQRTLKERGWYLGAKIKIFYPRSRHLEVRLEAGVVEVRNLASDGKIELDRGSATVTMKKDDAGSMKLRCDQGDALIRPVGERPLHAEKILEWNEGDGECDLEVELGEGAIVVDLL